MATRIRIAGYVITPVLYRDDGVSLSRVPSGPSEVAADKLAVYVEGLQRDVLAMEEQAEGKEPS